MAFMLSRPRIMDSLKQEFAQDEINPIFWIVDTKRTASGKCVTATFVGTPGQSPMSVAAARGYAIRAYGLVASIVNRPVEVVLSPQPDVFCTVSNETNGEPLLYDSMGRSPAVAQEVVIKNPLSSGEMHCEQCGTRTDGSYARNICRGMHAELAPLRVQRHPTLRMCAECAELEAKECRRVYMSSPESIRDTIALMRVDIDDVRIGLASGLRDIGPDAIPYLVEALANTDDNVAAGAKLALGLIGQPAIPALLDVIATGHPRESRAAAVSLAMIGEPAVPLLVQSLADGHNAVLFAFAAMEPDTALSGLSRLIDGTDDRMAAAASTALALVRDMANDEDAEPAG